ncbi:hypothetical protein GCM10029964_077890 [Kibdelosporangium lantanae]
MTGSVMDAGAGPVPLPSYATVQLIMSPWFVCPAPGLVTFWADLVNTETSAAVATFPAVNVNAVAVTVMNEQSRLMRVLRDIPALSGAAEAPVSRALSRQN